MQLNGSEGWDERRTTVAEITRTIVHTGSTATYLNRAGHGNGTAVLWLHGSGPGATGWSNWQHALPWFGERYDCLAPDLLGFGSSTHPDPPPRGMRAWMRLWVDQVLGLLDVLGVHRAHLVGNSMGSAVALHLLAEASGRFDKVVLMGPVGVPCRLTVELDRIWGFYEDPSPRTMAQIIGWFVADPNFLAGQLDAIAQARFEAAIEPAARRSFEAMFPRPRQEHLDQLTVPDALLVQIRNPVLLVHGRHDRVVPMATSHYLLERLPNCDLHVFGRCGHWTQIEQRDQFHSLVDHFFSI